MNSYLKNFAKTQKIQLTVEINAQFDGLPCNIRLWFNSSWFIS